MTGPAAAEGGPPRIAPAWLSAPATRAVLAALTGAAPRFVGGCVRDALLGIEAADVDLCVTTPPEETARLLEAAGLKAVPTGMAHGTVTAVARGRGFEVTTLRRDVETDGRRAVVAYTTDLAEDAGRRDFTMNALYADGKGRVIDPLGGLPDLRAGRVRFIGNPRDRIREDYLRILRFFRFTARFGREGVDGPGLAACAGLAPGLEGLARERVGWEMRRLLGAEDPVAAVEAMAQAGVLARVAPEAEAGRLAPLVAAERAAGAAPAWPRRAVALGAEGADWRLSREETKRLAAIRAALQADAPPAEAAWRWGMEAARDAALIRAAAEGASPGAPGAAALEGELARGAAARFPLGAKALAAAGVPKGPEMGRALRRLEAAWVASDFTLDRDALLARLDIGPDEEAG